MTVDHLSDDELLRWFTGVMERAIHCYPMTPMTEAYGTAAEQVIDWWGDPNAEVVVASIHGGYFAAEYDRSVNEPLARALASEGLLVANLEYRRAGSCTDPMDTVVDVRTGLGKVVSRAGGRPMVVVGHSAGGYLAIAGSTVPGVTAVVPLAPATDLAACCLEGWDEGAISAWIGCHHSDDTDRWDRMDLKTVGFGDVPTVIVHGVDDQVVPASQTLAYVSAQPHVRHHVLADVGHYEFLDPESGPAGTTKEWILALARGGEPTT